MIYLFESLYVTQFFMELSHALRCFSCSPTFLAIRVLICWGVNEGWVRCAVLGQTISAITVSLAFACVGEAAWLQRSEVRSYIFKFSLLFLLGYIALLLRGTSNRTISMYQRSHLCHQRTGSFRCLDIPGQHELHMDISCARESSRNNSKMTWEKNLTRINVVLPCNASLNDEAASKESSLFLTRIRCCNELLVWRAFPKALSPDEPIRLAVRSRMRKEVLHSKATASCSAPLSEMILAWPFNTLVAFA